MVSLLRQFPDELEKTLAEFGEPRFRAVQIFTALCRGEYIQEMTTLSKKLREDLALRYPGKISIERALVSKKDGTQKLLFLLPDGVLVEGVLMQHHHGATLCISTQAGCRMGCAFCASTLYGLTRNLSAGEMLGMAAQAHRHLGGGPQRRIDNLVLMGSGEPLDNYDETVRFLRLINNPQGMCMGLRHISLSTCGLVEGIRKFIAEDLPITLSVSLHAPTDELRATLMPIAKSNPLQDLIGVCGEYIQVTGRRVIFEYALIRGVNDGQEQAAQLRALLKGLQAHVNVIPLNDVPERSLKGASAAEAHAFRETLCELGLSATVRRSLGEDIDGACGQLRNRALNEAKP